MSKEELKPCPFCGRKEIKICNVMIDYNAAYKTPLEPRAICKWCDAVGPGQHQTDEEAAAKWCARKSALRNV